MTTIPRFSHWTRSSIRFVGGGLIGLFVGAVTGTSAFVSALIFSAEDRGLTGLQALGVGLFELALLLFGFCISMKLGEKVFDHRNTGMRIGRLAAIVGFLPVGGFVSGSAVAIAFWVTISGVV